MKFEPGDLVWVGWCPDHWFLENGSGKNVRTAQGEIRSYVGLQEFVGFGVCNEWLVDIPGIGEYGVAEPLLKKIPPEDYGWQDTKQDESSRETIPSD